MVRIICSSSYPNPENVKSREGDVKSQEKRERLEWFLDRAHRGKWLANIFSVEHTPCLNYTFVPGSGRVTYDAEEIKGIYLTEGTSVLKNKVQCLPPYDEKYAQKSIPPPG